MVMQVQPVISGSSLTCITIITSVCIIMYLLSNFLHVSVACIHVSTQVLKLMFGAFMGGFCLPLNDCILRRNENDHCTIFLDSNTCNVFVLRTQCTKMSLISCNIICSWTYSADNSDFDHHTNFPNDERSFNATVEELKNIACNQIVVVCRHEQQLHSVHFEVLFLLEESGGKQKFVLPLKVITILNCRYMS